MPSKQQLSDEAQATLERKDLLRQAYGKATALLRDEHRDEFNSLYAEQAAALGVEWSPRLSEEEKAARALTQILTEFPHLRDTITEGATE